MQGRQVRIGEIAVIGGVFFATHRTGNFLIGIPQLGFLNDFGSATCAIERDLILNFVVDGGFD